MEMEYPESTFYQINVEDVKILSHEQVMEIG
jgi:hypothetical protein